MRTKISGSAYILLLIAAVVLASLGCVGPQQERPGQLQNESRSVALGDAKYVNAQVVMGVGRLTMEGGTKDAKDLLDANFVYNLPSWKPEVSYSVADGIGNLKVSQPSSSGNSLGGNINYDWNLRLNSGVPINLKTTLGAGESNLKLGAVSLAGLGVQSGAGNVTIDLSGKWKNSLNASVEAGVGNLVLVLPRDTGVIVNLTHGIGSVEVDSGLKSLGNAYVNDAYREAGTNLNVNVEAGIGRIRLTLA